MACLQATCGQGLVPSRPLVSGPLLFSRCVTGAFGFRSWEYLRATMELQRGLCLCNGLPEPVAGIAPGLGWQMRTAGRPPRYETCWAHVQVQSRKCRTHDQFDDMPILHYTYTSLFPDPLAHLLQRAQLVRKYDVGGRSITAMQCRR